MSLKQRIVGELREQLGREPTEAEINEARDAFIRERLGRDARERGSSRNPKPSPPLRAPKGSRDMIAEYTGKTIGIVGNSFPAPKDR